MALTVQKPRAYELPKLFDLCFRAKAALGYDEDFMQAYRRELSFTPQDLELTHIGVAKEHGQILGVVQVRIAGHDAHLLKLFVEPGVTREGVGKRLLAWAANISKTNGTRQMVIADWDVLGATGDEQSEQV